jgi:Ring finger domain
MQPNKEKEEKSTIGETGQKRTRDQVEEGSNTVTDTCHICTEELKDRRAVIDCKHYFCMNCIRKWADIENTCPYCKQKFTAIKERKIRKGHKRNR